MLESIISILHIYIYPPFCRITCSFQSYRRKLCRIYEKYKHVVQLILLRPRVKISSCILDAYRPELNGVRHIPALIPEKLKLRNLSEDSGFPSLHSHPELLGQ